MELNMNYAAEKYARIAEALGVFDSAASVDTNAKTAIERVKEIRRETGAPESLAPIYQARNLIWRQLSTR
jgi:alcohol dehydrogenase class IV